MSMYAIEIEWHDRQGQHGCVLDRMCQNAPIRKYELLKNDQAGNVGIVEP